MFDVGSFRAKTCAGISRRSFLRVGASVPLAMGLPGALQAENVAATARAKTVLFVWLWGAPSHLDTCDPKPEAPLEYRGPFGAIATRTPGVQFTEMLPMLAQRSNLFTLLRNHVTTAPGHPDAGTVSLTGYPETFVPLQPNFGSIVAKHRGHKSSLPQFISLARGVVMDGGRRIEGYGGGVLSQAYDPFLVGCTERGEVEIPALRLLDSLTPDRIQDRKQLLAQLDGVPRALESNGFRDWGQTFQSAYGLLMDPAARNAFDLTRETQATRDRYGQTMFGQSSLLARRLVEAEVPYIQLNYSRHVEAITPNFEFGWDTHIFNFELLQDWHCPTLDRAFSALLDDLHERGLLETTLVVAMGEFGRTPRINNRAARDHWPQCYFSIWAGAGIEPGRVIGKSDKLGAAPVANPITPLMVGTTIAELAGVNVEARARMRVLDGGKVIDELI